MLNGILLEFGKSILNCWKEKLNVRRILENVNLPSSILELFINSEETSAIDTSKVVKVSNKDFVANKEDEFVKSNDGEEQSCSQLPYHQICKCDEHATAPDDTNHTAKIHLCNWLLCEPYLMSKVCTRDHPRIHVLALAYKPLPDMIYTLADRSNGHNDFPAIELFSNINISGSCHT
ncbi:hypothetical protein Tco_0811194 [Tanacetum coccineum]